MNSTLAVKLVMVWASFPEQRFGQFLVNVAGEYDPYYVTDDVLEQQLDLVLEGGHPFVTLP